MRRRVRSFAAPLVVVLAPACKKPADAPTPPRAIDAGVVTVAGGKDKLMFFDSASGGCMTFPDREPVACNGNPDLIFAWKTITTKDGAVTYDSQALRCQVQRPAPAGQSPPPPEPIACPPELLPTLTGEGKMTKQTGDACYWHDLAILCPGKLVFEDPGCYQIDGNGQRQYAECPPDVLPPAPTDVLVYAQGTHCFPINASGGQGRVTCPPGGATVILPDPTTKDLGSGHHIGWDQWNGACREWTDMSCPQGYSCNPPPPAPVPCPSDLLPTLANGEKPTAKKDGKCYWNAYEVACK